MASFVLIGEDGQETPFLMNGLRTVQEKGVELQTHVPLQGGGDVKAVFREKDLEFSVAQS
jgi:hypothetical protein